MIEPITGRYAHLALGGRAHRIYYEEAGAGIPLLCLHTAGSDSRQYRAVLNDPAILENYRAVAFDMPWHGKSSPPPGWQRDEPYRLTTDSYTAMIMTIAREHARELRALIGLQSAAYVERYYDAAWMDHAEVHGGRAAGGLAYGLMSPLSPHEHRWETVWHYMQGGPGVFSGDLHFYQVEGDIRSRIGAIDTGVCPLYMLTGEYDYSASPRDTEAAAARIPGAKVTIMKGLGHFPMSENPEAFLAYLRPVLEEIRARE